MPPSGDAPTVRVGIVGGGIGGLATAIALDRHGLEADVYEAAAAYEPAGAGLLLATNALRSLDRLGLAEAVRAAGAVVDRLRLFDGRGRPLRTLDLRREARRYGQPYCYLHRAALQRHLLDRLGDDRVQQGRTCASVAFGDARGEPTVRFEDGTEVGHDVVLGADGLRSAVRASGWSARPRELGTVAYRGVADGVPEALERETWQVWGRGTRAGVAPLDDDRTYWFVTANGPAIEPGSPSARREVLLERVAAYPEPFQVALSATTPEAILATPLAELPPLGTWHRGRVALLGDAAHAPLPYLGQGAAQALADAVILGRELGAMATGDGRTAGADHRAAKAALEAYERQRRPRADRVVRSSRLSGRLAQAEGRLATAALNGVVHRAPRPLLWLPRYWLARGP